MKTFISRWLLLAAGILCLNFNTPAKAGEGDKERIETIREALTTATEKSKPKTVEADFTDGLRLIQLAIKPAKTDFDKEKNLIFDYAGKSFVLMSEKEDYIILRGKPKAKIVVFDPKAKE